MQQGMMWKNLTANEFDGSFAGEFKDNQMVVSREATAEGAYCSPQRFPPRCGRREFASWYCCGVPFAMP